MDVWIASEAVVDLDAKVVIDVTWLLKRSCLDLGGVEKPQMACIRSRISGMVAK